MTVRLRGDHVRLGPLTEHGVPMFMTEMASWGVEVPADRVRERIATSGRWDDHQLDLGIEVDGRLLGDIQARHCPRTDFPGHFEIGISLFDVADRRRGVGTEAVRLVTDYLFDSEGATRVRLGTDVDNLPMRRLAERVGFRFEGVMRAFHQRPGEDSPRDYALYAMTEADHREAKARTG
jgi:RimJ/RimL family protein N-acetyltransferase